MKWKYLAYAGLAASALVAAGAYFYWKSNGENSGIVLKQVIKREFYIQLIQEMRQYFNLRYLKSVKEYRETRRKFEPQSSEYENAVVAFHHKTQALVEDAQKEVLRRYRLSKDNFELSVNFYDTDPELKDLVASIVDTKITINSDQILDRDETKRILDYYQSRLREFESDCPDLEEYMIINTRIEDEVFNEFGIELDVLTESWEIYKKDIEELYEQIRNQTYCVLASTDNSF